MVFIFGILVVLIKSAICFDLGNLWNRITYLDPEATMSSLELIRHNGFPSENYTVTTSDGFILDLYRIPGGRARKADQSKPPLLIVHGTETEADIWLVNLPNQSIPFLAADAGYDVWLANCRCSRNSCKHKTLDRKSEAFWDWSWDEIAVYDLPPIIDQVLNSTGHSQLYYLAHSLGGQAAFALLSTLTEYNAKIKAIFTLSSQGNFADANIFLRTGSSFESILQIVNALRIYEVGLPSFISPKILPYIAKFFPLAAKLAVGFGGIDKNFNCSRIPVYVGHSAGSTSFKVIRHDAQIMKYHKIQKYDWGRKKNLQKYGSPTPPEYDLRKVTVPTHLYYGSKDEVVGGKKNAQFLKDNLGNVQSCREVGTNYNHNDMWSAINAAPLVYNEIIERMNNGSK